MFHQQKVEDLASTKHSLANHRDLLLPSAGKRNSLVLVSFYIMLTGVGYASD
jgi:hypothetical protein